MNAPARKVRDGVMGLTLFGYYRSSTSYRVRIGLNLKQLDYTQVSVNLREGEHRAPAFAAINPHQSVPMLEVDSVEVGSGFGSGSGSGPKPGPIRLSQSLAILDWLEAHHPAPSFWPEDPAAAQLCRELYYAIATEVHAPNNQPVLNYLRDVFGADDAGVERWIQTWVHRTFAPVEARLTAWDWLSGDLPFGAPGLFEIVLVPQLYNARRFNVNLADFPRLTAIDAHCASLDPFARAHPDTQPDAP